MSESEKRLREYVEKDKIYQEYKSNKKPSDFERFCFVHCGDIENVLDELKELKEQLATVETYRCFNMGDNIGIVSLLKGDYVRNKYEYETIDKYKSVLKKIRKVLNNQMDYREFVDMINAIDEILSKVKE